MVTWNQEEVDISMDGAACVIDGDQGIRNSLQVLLGTLGVTAVTFSTAEEFLDRLNGEMPSFLITELALPGMTGFELKEALDRKGAQIPVIGLTSYAGPQIKEEAFRLGFLDLIEKPFVYWMVVERIQKTLGIAC